MIALIGASAAFVSRKLGVGMPNDNPDSGGGSGSKCKTEVPVR